MRVIRRKRLLIGLLAGLVLVGVTLLRGFDPSVITAVRMITLDGYQRLWPRTFQDVPVRIVDIDEESLRIYGQWPWRRDRLAELTATLTGMGAASVAYDILFAESDRLSPHRYLPELTAEQPDAVMAGGASAIRLPDTDLVFADAIAAAPVVLGFAVVPEGTGAPPARGGFAFAGSDPATHLPTFGSVLSNLTVLNDAAMGIGGISLSSRDTGGVVRRIPMVFSDGQNLFPSLSLESLRVAQDAGSTIVRTATASGEVDVGTTAITDIKVGAVPFPTTADGELWVYFTPDTADRYVSVVDVLDPQRRAAIRDRIDGHIVYVGTSSVGLLDIRATPLGETVPGVSVHAQATEQILTGDFLSRPDWADGAEVIATFVLGLVVIALVLSFGAAWAAGIGSILALGVYAGAAHLFRTQGLLLDPIYPTATALFVVYATATALLYVLTEREKRFVRAAFGQYLAPEMVRRLETAPDALRLGGEMRDMTILFMDIRGFTPISEQLTPTDLVAFLNQLLSPLSEEIQERDGTIDKYIGDSIMAFWNAPMTVEDHARLACRAALNMIEIVDALNARDAFGFQARGLAAQRVRIGVGLNTGEACVGNMGSDRRFNYSVIGDAVNVAARIEASCKAVGSDCVISEATARAAADFAVLDAGAIPLKGKSIPIKLFALAGDPDYAETQRFRDLKTDHDRLMAAIALNDHAAADMALTACRAIAPAHLSDFSDRLADKVTELQVRPEADRVN